jgi:hypothetical protein
MLIVSTSTAVLRLRFGGAGLGTRQSEAQNYHDRDDTDGREA